MAIFQALFAALGRQLGRLLNTIFSWATTTLFGKVPQERQTLLSIVAFGSVIWIVVVFGVIVPKVGVFLLSFVKLPSFVQDWWIRLAMLAAALVVPAVMGFLSTKVTDPEDQPKGGKAVFRQILHGYPYTVATSLALIMMVFFVPILKLRTLAKRWTTEHLPIVVEEEDYLSMVAEIERALDKAGKPVTRTQANALMRLPIKVLTSVAGRGKSNLVADNLTTLRSDKLELILYPSDLAISGKKYDAAHARAVVSEQLSFSRAYLTWTKEANELEDRLRKLWTDAKARTAGEQNTDLIKRLKLIEKDLRSAEIQHEEWDVLFREKLLVERGILQLVAGLTDRLKEPAEANAEELGSEKIPSSPFGLALKLIPQGLSVLGAALVAMIFRSRSDRPAVATSTRANEAYRVPAEPSFVVNEPRT
ncbi:MAG: hypothetical protein ACM30E_07790, partial [Nitrososphaerales archaeon]